MSLITIDRSLIASDTEKEVDEADADCSSKSSEDFLMCKGSAVGLNINSRRRSSCIKPNDDIQEHLKKIISFIRFEDYIQLVVRLQCAFPIPHSHRYCCIISTMGKQETEESIVLGVDVKHGVTSVGLVLPIYQDMTINLDGDGGFKLVNKDTERQFKPVSVQALWAAFQAVHKACEIARTNGYFSRGITHHWTSHYQNLPMSDTHQIQEWLKTDDSDAFNRATPPTALVSTDASTEDKERLRMEALIRDKLQALMYIVDLEDVTVLQLRERLEEELNTPLQAYRHFIGKEVLTIYGQMDEASTIFDHLLLGTTFNASNRAELERRNVTHILNVTREVDNFFPADKFSYKNIRVFDDEESQLLPYWEETHRFINEAKEHHTCCLVHCKMGISRSASTVIAYAMKENDWDLETAYAHVKSRRPCVQPNSGFLRQLQTYQGILEASSNRHKPIFREQGQIPLPPTNPSNRRLITIPHTIIEEVSSPPHLSNSNKTESGKITGRDYEDLRPNLLILTSSPVSFDGVEQQQYPSTLDLDAELFAFKPLCDAVGSSISSPSKISQSTVESGSVVATASQSFRQWHPDVVENVSRGELRPVYHRSNKCPSAIQKIQTALGDLPDQSATKQHLPMEDSATKHVVVLQSPLPCEPVLMTTDRCGEQPAVMTGGSMQISTQSDSQELGTMLPSDLYAQPELAKSSQLELRPPGEEIVASRTHLSESAINESESVEMLPKSASMLPLDRCSHPEVTHYSETIVENDNLANRLHPEPVCGGIISRHSSFGPTPTPRSFSLRSSGSIRVRPDDSWIVRLDEQMTNRGGERPASAHETFNRSDQPTHKLAARRSLGTEKETEQHYEPLQPVLATFQQCQAGQKLVHSSSNSHTDEISQDACHSSYTASVIRSATLPNEEYTLKRDLTFLNVSTTTIPTVQRLSEPTTSLLRSNAETTVAPL